MIQEHCRSEYNRWKQQLTAPEDVKLQKELTAMEENTEAIKDAFYKDLHFGTGGLRGVMGAGTNRMNIYTVAKASQGLADYVNRNYTQKESRIAIAYDSRNCSEIFARTAAEVFAANAIRAEIFDRLMPTPCLSFAVRTLGCAAGVVITASHNSAEYNGYKVYGSDGCQITTEAAAQIQEAIKCVDVFANIKRMEFVNAQKCGWISYISEKVYDNYIEVVKHQSVLYGDRADKDIRIVYSPLNGTGRDPVLRTLIECGYTHVTVVAEQEQPDGDFPTCPYPNPEARDAMALGIQYAEREEADLLVATDPDCDRVGIAVKNEHGTMELLTANETGLLLFDYICAQRQKHRTMPENPVMMKTIVTSDLAERIAARYGVETVNVLTGFKYIGEQIGCLEAEGRADAFVFGFEESYGYLTGTYVRDKDGVDGTLLICEMAAYYKAREIRLVDKLNELYRQYGYCLHTQHSYRYEGAEGSEKMNRIMDGFRHGIKNLAGKAVTEVRDYLQGRDGLPRSDVIRFVLEDGSSAVIRPSGTEPKLKVYLSVCAPDRIQAAAKEKEMIKELLILCLL